MANIPADQQNVADWDACDEHERSFPRGDPCPGCLYDETISLRAECATKALEIERITTDLAQCQASLALRNNEVAQLKQDNERLNKKCGALAVLMYGQPNDPSVTTGSRVDVPAEPR